MKKYLPEYVIFLTGLLTMIYEVVGARVMGPYFGTSIFVWTSLIGIIMASLSLGYWLGGKLSLRKSNYSILSWLLFGASVFVFLTVIGNTYVLDRIVKYIPEFRLRIVFSSVLLFGPASVLFAMTLPYCAKLKINNLVTSGAAIGNLYALSTIGSITGTFLSGFVLVPTFGFANILYFISAVLIATSLLIFLYEISIVRIATATVFLFIVIGLWVKSNQKELDYIDVDTKYNRVIIYNTTDRSTGRPVKMLRVNNESSSAMYTDIDDDLVFKVLKYYRLISHFTPGFSSSLMIGGSGYAFPKDYLSKYPDATMDVVEIDPGLTEIAHKHFDLPNDSRLSIYHEDGRTFLNRCSKKYDAIFMDAYKSLITVPYQLTTREAVQKIYDNLNDNGAVYANLISSLDEKTNEFLRTEYATYNDVFPYVYLFAVQYPNPTHEEKSFFQNILLVGLKSQIQPVLTSQNAELNTYLKNRIEVRPAQNILTDEYAPVEFMISKVLK